VTTQLGTHAIAELTYQGVDETRKGNIVAIVGGFADFSDEERPEVVEQVMKLLSFEVLSDLTDDPDEWVAKDDVIPGQQIWQSNRWPDAWSYSADHSNYFLMSQHNPGSSSPGIVFPTSPAP
jgi:hypothetical protein